MRTNTSEQTHTGRRPSFDGLLEILDVLHAMTERPIPGMQKMLFRISTKMIESPEDIPLRSPYPLYLNALYDILEELSDSVFNADERQL